MFGVIGGIANIGMTNDYGSSRRYTQPIQAAISVLFYAFGFLVASRYSSIGLRVVWKYFFVFIFKFNSNLYKYASYQTTLESYLLIHFQ